MGAKVTVDNVEYDVDSLNEKARTALLSWEFTNFRIEELTNMQALLQRAKNSYVDNLRKEIIAKKAGLVLDDL